MTDLYSILVSAGQVLGVPLAVALTIGAFVIRDLVRRVAKLEAEKKEAERMLDSKLDKIYTKINDMGKDVAVLLDRDKREKE